MLKMIQTKTFEQRIEELRQKNSELVKQAEFWRCQYRKVEDEKLHMIKEITDLTSKKKHCYYKIKEYCDLLQESVCRSINEISQFVSCADGINKIISESEGLESNRDVSSANFMPNEQPSNVHHVRPMIQGVTLKTPILRMSRANLGEIGMSALNIRNKSSQRTFEKNIDIASENSEIRPLHEQNSLQKDQNEDYVKSNNLEPFVSLNRIDSHYKMMLQKKQLQYDAIQNEDNISNVVTSYSELENKENAYVDENETFNEDSAYMKYAPGLECITEESENDMSSAVKNTMTTGSVEETTGDRIQDFEDPLEGPSWLFDTNREYTPQLRNSSYNFITHRKKYKKETSKSDLESDKTKVKNVCQVPDSTTDFGNQLAVLPQSQSTPYCEKNVQDEKSCGSITEESLFVESPHNDDQNKTNIIQSVTKNPRKSNKTRQSNGGKLSRTKRNSKKRSASTVSSTPQDDSECTLRDSSDQSTRPKRYERKNYKEPSNIKKLRRS